MLKILTTCFAALALCATSSAQGPTSGGTQLPATPQVTDQGLSLINAWASVIVGTNDPDNPSESKYEAIRAKPPSGKQWKASTEGSGADQYILIDVETVILLDGVNSKYGAGHSLLYALIHEHIHTLGFGAGPVINQTTALFPGPQCEHVQMYFAVYFLICVDIVRLESDLEAAQTLEEYHAIFINKLELCKIAKKELKAIMGSPNVPEDIGVTGLLDDCADKTEAVQAGNITLPDLDGLQEGVELCDYCD